MVRFSKFVGSVRIQLLLLKTESGKHGCKIIFKWVDSVVITVFNIFFSEQSGYRSREQCTLSLAQCIHVHEQCSYYSYVLEKKEKKKKKKVTWNQKHRCAMSQMQLLHSESLCMSTAVTIHTHWKKEKKETWNYKRRREISQMQTGL